jgi:hypothetical protein
VFDSSSSRPRFPRQDIDWNDTPWQEDIFEDNKDMQAVQNAIVTLDVALIVSFLMMFYLTMYC